MIRYSASIPLRSAADATTMLRHGLDQQELLVIYCARDLQGARYNFLEHPLSQVFYSGERLIKY